MGIQSGIMGAPMSSFSVDDPAKAFLSGHDFTAVSFWIISIAMIAATVFFYAEAATVTSHWKTSLHVWGLVTLVAAVHYMYMREYWVAVGSSPIVYRYVDWTITVPLQMIEFNLILKAANKPVSAGMFWGCCSGLVPCCLRLRRRDWRPGGMDRLHLRPVWLVLHPQGDLHGRSWWSGRRVLAGCQGVLQQHALHRNRGLVDLPSRIFLRLPS